MLSLTKKYIYDGWDTNLKIASRILEFNFKYYNLKQVNNNSDTVLIILSSWLLKPFSYPEYATKTILKILEYGPEHCNLKQINKNGDTLLKNIIRINFMGRDKILSKITELLKINELLKI